MAVVSMDPKVVQRLSGARSLQMEFGICFQPANILPRLDLMS